MVNPLRLDPTRTSGLVKRFTRDYQKRLNRVRTAVNKLIVEEDAFGLKKENQPPTISRVNQTATFNAGNLWSVQLNLHNEELLSKIESLQSQLKLIEVENQPHITIRFGLISPTLQQVKSLLPLDEEILFKVTGIDSFSNYESGEDAVHLTIDSPQLHKLNSLLGSLPNETKFKTYRPHHIRLY